MTESLNDENSPLDAGIGKKAAKGALWLTAAQILSRGLGSIRIILLAAILPLSELGLFGIAIIVMQFADRLSESGMRQALIQRDGGIDDYMSTAWVAQIARGVVLGLIIILAATSIESFFEKENLVGLLLALAAIPLLQGTYNIGVLNLHREMRYGKVVLLSLSVSLTDLLVSILLAWFWPVAMSLVIGKIAGVSAGLFVSYTIEQRRPAFQFSFVRFKELYKFGFWVFVGTLISFTLIRGGDLVIGKLLPASDLAIYQIAYGIACIPLMEVMGVISVTTFSAFSRIQNNRERLTSAFLRVLALSSILATFSITGFFCFSWDFTRLFFRDELKPIAAMLPWLAVWGACRAMGSTNSVLFQAIGKPALATLFQFLMLIVFAVLLFPLVQSHKSMGVVISLVIAGLAAQLGRYSLTVFELQISPMQVAARVLLPLVLGGVSGLATFFTMSVLPVEQHFLRMMAGLTTLVAVFVPLACFVDKRFKFGIVNFVLTQFPFVQRRLNKVSLLSAASAE